MVLHCLHCVSKGWKQYKKLCFDSEKSVFGMNCDSNSVRSCSSNFSFEANVVWQSLPVMSQNLGAYAA